MTAEPHEVLECRTGGGEPQAFGRPAELIEQSEGVEDRATLDVGPLAFDQADQVHVVEVSVAGGIRIEQVNAVPAGPW